MASCVRRGAFTLLLLFTGCSAGAADVEPAVARSPAAPTVTATAASIASVAPATPVPAPSGDPAPPAPPGPARVLWVVEPVDNSGTYKLQVVPGGGLVVVGHNRSLVTSPDDMFIEAMSDEGNARWHRSGTAKWVRAVSGTAAHHFFASEFSGKLDFEGVRAHDANSGAFVAKVGENGALVWGRVLGTPSFTRVSDVAATPDGGAAVALGIFAAAKNGPLAVPVAGGEDTVIVKYDAAGQIAWTRAFGWPGYDEPARMFADAEGNVTVAGTRWSSAVSWSMALASGSCHGWITRLGPGGEPKWSVDLGADTTRVTIRHAAPAANGALVVAGSMLGRHRLGSVDLDTGGKERGYLAQIDRDGHVAWARLHDTPDCLAVDPADRLVLAGPKGISIETAAGESTTVLAFEADAVESITDCRLDGARHLYLSGTAKPNARIGDKPLRGPVLKRPRTSWLKPYDVGFVARIAL